MAISEVRSVEVSEHQKVGSQFRAIPHVQAARTLIFDPTSIISCHLPSYAPSNMLRESLKMGSEYLQMTESCSDNSKTVLQALKAFRQKVTAEDEE